MFRQGILPCADQRHGPLIVRPARKSESCVAVRASSAAGDGGRQGGKRRIKKAKQPGMYEVLDISPPLRSLGIHALPPNTHNGDEIEVLGGSYVVQSVVMQYKLHNGRYKEEHKRLEVNQTGRFLCNMFLEGIYQMDANAH